MMSSYRKLGQYIREVDIRNTEGKEENLLGVSTNKVFITSIANTVGTDFKKYKIVQKNQFTYVSDTSRRGDRIGIALLKDYVEGLVSSAYTVFKIIDHNELLPEYLMMWFSRPEFDRYARFMSHGSVREILGWEEMCNVELPVPGIDIQKAIVEKYNTIVKRMEINKELNQKLEETAQAIYRQWFVDFEFPDDNGNPYKSSGGDMEYNAELDKDIPRGWEARKLDILVDLRNGKARPEQPGGYPVYGGNGIMSYAGDYNNEDVIIIGRVGENCGSVYYEPDKCWISDNAIMAKSKSNISLYCYRILLNLDLNKSNEGTGQPLLTQDVLYQKHIVHTNSSFVVNKFESLMKRIHENMALFEQENKVLMDFIDILGRKITKF